MSAYTGPSNTYSAQSVMEDVSDSESDPDLEAELDPDQQKFYEQQQQQAIYYQQHQAQYASSDNLALSHHPTRHSNEGGDEDEEMYSDDESSVASIPDENIDFSLTYALHTFLATVEGQASVVKGDSLLLLDDANSYWWLVRVLKTEDVGYIPAENIETPYERLARLNKHRNVDLASATVHEKQSAEVQGRERLKGAIAGRAKGIRAEKSGEDVVEKRRVLFAPPTYVEHPGVTWSSDEEDGEEGDDDQGDLDEVEGRELDGEYDDRQDGDVIGVEDALSAAQTSSMLDMEPDDGVEWADAAVNDRQRMNPPNGQGGQGQARTDPYLPKETYAQGYGGIGSPGSSINSSPGSAILDPAQAGNTTRRITVTPAVASGPSGPLLPSALHANNSTTMQRKTSGQSIGSITSSVSLVSAGSSAVNEKDQDDARGKMRKSHKGSKEDLQEGQTGEKRKSKTGMLGGLFSRGKGKEKKGISSSDAARNSEDSILSGGMDYSPMTDDTSPANTGSARALTPGSRPSPGNPTMGPGQPMLIHGHKVAQNDQAIQQAYTSKYLNKSPSGSSLGGVAPDTSAVSQSSMRLAAAASNNGGRPASIILSPNPAGPPLLNVIRVFAGEHVKSEASFKTVLVNETTSSSDLIRQLHQRFHLHHSSSGGVDSGYYLTIKDVSGEEMELSPMEKPLAAFQEAVKRWASDDDDSDRKLGTMTPTVKRSSVSSINSVVSLSNHPAIAKLGMNDFSDDSTVKIYLNRRRPGSQHGGSGGMPESSSEFSSYSAYLSTVQESSPESGASNWSKRDSLAESDATATPPRGTRTAPSLNVSTQGHPSPDRLSSPSAKFTIQILIHSGDLPDGAAFDTQSEAIIPKAAAMGKGGSSSGLNMDMRRRLLVLPRNATIVEAIEQGLERFAIQDGVVDGGDDVEDRVGHRRGLAKYVLTAASSGRERQLFPSSKVIDAYQTPPRFVSGQSNMESRRRSRDMFQSLGSQSDILPTDPIFILRRSGQRSQPPVGQQQVSSPDPRTPLNPDVTQFEGRAPMSPQEIIAAQRAATRANQRALISAHANTKQGVDVVIPDRGTFRSSRLLQAGGDEVVRYSFIDDNGETYDVSEIIQEELGDGAEPETAKPPMLRHTSSSNSAYVTAPSTPDPMAQQIPPPPRGSQDILRGAVQGVQGQPEGKLEEKLQRVINKVKNWRPLRSPAPDDRASTPTGRNTPSNGRATPQPSNWDTTPRAFARSDSANGSRPANLEHPATSVNRIINKHHQRQQPSIASIISDLSGSTTNNTIDARERISREPSLDPLAERPTPLTAQKTPTPDLEPGLRDPRDLHAEGTGSSTPLTATSSTHPTPPFSTVGVFPRGLSNVSPIGGPIHMQDDFGMKNLMAIIDIRTRERYNGTKKPAKVETDDVERMFYGEKIDWEGVHPEIRGCFEGLADRMSQFDRDIDEALALAGGPR